MHAHRQVWQPLPAATAPDTRLVFRHLRRRLDVAVAVGWLLVQTLRIVIRHRQLRRWERNSHR